MDLLWERRGEALTAVCSPSLNPWLDAPALITSRLCRNTRSQLNICREVFLGEQAVKSEFQGSVRLSKVRARTGCFPPRQL